MDRQRIIDTLRAHEAELKANGLLHLRIFGSVARGDNTPVSDVDLSFDYDESDGSNLLIAYDYEKRVSELIQAKAHLSSAKHIRKEFRQSAEEFQINVY